MYRSGLYQMCFVPAPLEPHCNLVKVRTIVVNACNHEGAAEWAHTTLLGELLTNSSNWKRLYLNKPRSS